MPSSWSRFCASWMACFMSVKDMAAFGDALIAQFRSSPGKMMFMILERMEIAFTRVMRGNALERLGASSLSDVRIIYTKNLTFISQPAQLGYSSIGAILLPELGQLETEVAQAVGVDLLDGTILSRNGNVGRLQGGGLLGYAYCVCWSRERRTEILVLVYGPSYIPECLNNLDNW